MSASMVLPDPENTPWILKNVAEYATQFARIFHTFVLNSEVPPRGFEAGIGFLDATIITLTQVLSLFSNHEAESSSIQDERKILSNGGLRYIRLLAIECAYALAKIEVIFSTACQTAKERKERRKLERNNPPIEQKPSPWWHLQPLKVDENGLTELLEAANWRSASDGFLMIMNRLDEIQLHLLLVYQVASVGGMVQDLPSGLVDMKSMVTMHERIVRTADLVGLKLPRGRSRTQRSGYTSDSSSLYSTSSSEIDSETGTVISIRSAKKTTRRSSSLPPPPPPPNSKPKLRAQIPSKPPVFTTTYWNQNVSSQGSEIPPPPPSTMPDVSPLSGPSSEPPILVLSAATPSMPTDMDAPTTPTTSAPVAASSNTNPPSYSENPTLHSRSASSLSTSTLLGTAPEESSSSGSSTTSASSASSSSSTITSYPTEKKYELEEEASESKEAEKQSLSEPRLFNSKSSGLVFKFKSLFRSKKSLAGEMQRVLLDNDSRLVACIIRHHDLREVPHSAFHSLETTHIRTILSQLNSNAWYNTYTTLTFDEHNTLSRLVNPFPIDSINREEYRRDIVALKVVRTNKINAWVMLLKDLLRNEESNQNKGRVILAIVREQFINGKPLPLYASHDPRLPLAPPPPPPPGSSCPPPPPPPSQRFRIPPSLTMTPRRTQYSDVKGPLPVMHNSCFGPRSGSSKPQTFGPGCPALSGGIQAPDSRYDPQNQIPKTPYEALIALTTYTAFTLRIEPSPITIRTSTPDWSRIALTQEPTPKDFLLPRITSFLQRGGNIIEAQNSLTNHQARQLSRIMDELRVEESDERFEWSWVEISLYDELGGQICDFSCGERLGVNPSSRAAVIHCTAKRMPRESCVVLELYVDLMSVRPVRTGPPPAPPTGWRPGEFIRVDAKKKREERVVNLKSNRSGSSSSSSRSSTSGSESESLSDVGSSVGVLRRKLRRERRRRDRIRKTNEGGSGSESEDEVVVKEEDPIKINIELKRGDDVLKALLGIWTVPVDIKGKGKMV